MGKMDDGHIINIPRLPAALSHNRQDSIAAGAQRNIPVRHWFAQLPGRAVIPPKQALLHLRFCRCHRPIQSGMLTIDANEGC